MRKKKGFVLILTLVVVLLLMVLGTSLVTLSTSTYKTEVASDNTNKLNMMTESGIEIALAEVKKTTLSSSLVNIMGLKSDDGNITCNVFFRSGVYDTSTKSYIPASGKYTIESNASNSTSSKTIRVPITQVTSTPSGVVPTNNLFYINSDVSDGDFNCGEANGDVYVNGNFYMSSGSLIKGKLISKGNITLTGGSSSANGIVSFGNVNLNGGGNINGDALVKGNVSFGGGTKVNGNVLCDSNLIMPQGNISNNATIGGNATFNGGTPKILGKLYYNGAATSIQQGSLVSNFVPLGAVKTSTYTAIDLSGYTNTSLPVVPVPTISQNPQMYNMLSINNNKITNSGTLTSSLFSSVNYGTTITIDTSSNDVSLLVNNFNFDPENGIDFEVTGTNKLYIYLKGSSAGFTVGSNQFIGMKDHSAISQIFIIGDGNQKISISNCELDAYIYVPSGSFSASGGALDKYIFQGSCITKSLSIQGNVSVNYLKQIIIGTPLAVLSDGQQVAGNWIVGTWSY